MHRLQVILAKKKNYKGCLNEIFFGPSCYQVGLFLSLSVLRNSYRQQSKNRMSLLKSLFRRCKNTTGNCILHFKSCACFLIRRHKTQKKTFFPKSLGTTCCTLSGSGQVLRDLSKINPGADGTAHCF